jgi:uncharacterized protein (TIGR03083 family)
LSSRVTSKQEAVCPCTAGSRPTAANPIRTGSPFAIVTSPISTSSTAYLNGSAEHINALRRQGNLLADAAERSGLSVPVPPCPGWQVKDLLRHTGYIHRWAAQHITECPDTVLDGPAEQDILRGGTADPELLDWFRAGHAALVETLSTADPGLVCATFMDAPSSLAFWARRQAHETAIHRADADSASGIRPEYDPEFAADGIDELIAGFGQRRKYRPSAEQPGGMRVQATDTGHAWYVGAEDGRLPATPGTSAPKMAASRPAGNTARPARPPAPWPVPRPACTCSCGTAATPLRPASRSPETPASSTCGSQASVSAGADQVPVPAGAAARLWASLDDPWQDAFLPEMSDPRVNLKLMFDIGVGFLFRQHCGSWSCPGTSTRAAAGRAGK